MASLAIRANQLICLTPMKRTAAISLSAVILCLTLIGCSDSNSLTQAEKANIKGGPPPADVWDKVGEAKANQPDRSKDYGTIPGESTTPPLGAGTHGPS